MHASASQEEKHAHKLSTLPMILYNRDLLQEKGSLGINILFSIIAKT